ncbi:MAG TPA: nitroreductase family deazaflavin-dependent oxidoreductase [Acidimicrobiales bacterium]|nr:nitroreductase family deazaflavin-dependent oxidoreductase [Acidimicrobiales bacterium]
MAPNDFNQSIIDEFRANGGVVGGPFEGAPVVLIHHTGRKSGEQRVNPLVYQKLDHGWAIFASFGGAPQDPDWYHNLLAHPATTAEIGTDTIPVTVRAATGAERAEIWERQKAAMPGFAEYEVKAAPRQIPVLVLEPR